jgi:hypothetical protein
MKVGGLDIQITGAVLRTAHLALDAYESVDDPGATLEALRASRIRIDLFTFMQKLPDTSPKYGYDGGITLPRCRCRRSITGGRSSQHQCSEGSRVAEKETVVARCLRRASSSGGFQSSTTSVPSGRANPSGTMGPGGRAQENGTFQTEHLHRGVFEEPGRVLKLVCDRDQGQAGLMQIVSMISTGTGPVQALIAQAVRSAAERDRHPLAPTSPTEAKLTASPISNNAAASGSRAPSILHPSHPAGPCGPPPGTAPSIRQSHSRTASRPASKSAQPVVRAAASGREGMNAR